ncbi:MAG TPA: 6-carboxytetrahydropterin synthase [Gemmatales bacterium]|nr:6-carboxytetrahydropterin synthase [Gemmatales bacterium]HMP60937.1 6-carboxytetrahydropterin synthase [Gemmatales bacterium]
MKERFQVRVTKDHLTFCSGHFITYEGSCCERLHGHNYRVAVEVEGPLDENRYVFDFIALKNLTQSLTDELDHRMMLPLESPYILVAQTGGQIEVRFEERMWSFPEGDCVLLPVANTTAELLAAHLARRLQQLLKEKHDFEPDRLSVEVEESPGQSARCTFGR